MIEAPLPLTLERRRHPCLAPTMMSGFAHPSEVIFAGLLDLYGIEWSYEPIEFTLEWGPKGTTLAGFRPDFWLPQQNCFVELTTAEQRLVTRKNAKVRRLKELYPEIAIEVVYQRDFYALIARHGIDVSTSSAA